MLVFHSLSIWAYKLRHFLIGQEINRPKKKKNKELNQKSFSFKASLLQGWLAH